MTSFKLSIATEAESDATAAEIERKLLTSLAQTNAQSRNESFVLKSTSDTGQLLGGLTASSSYGWLLIKTLWVDDLFQRTGLGSRLVAAAEQKGRELGCFNVWLDTSSPPAHAFYLKLGYHDFGMLENGPDQPPAEHRRWFMRKPL
ncbi:MAG: GNAT family N-acetyltransferase [Roseibium sp.]|uniref:GNAT family N-acetyltransferase n=1 Tax=Roseibium sp. TaxID=1936156 RepID=UPI00262C4C67|nr:GNAT family N-acetyltransferase [Roseibium sp.]MCV0424551.1 GNAT family N-acetyltransferase [Roseibium sp.]